MKQYEKIFKSSLLTAIQKTGEHIAATLKNGHKIFVAGNGGSASDSEHFAGEFLSGYNLPSPLPVISLCGNMAAITAIANDSGFEQVFTKQIIALSSAGDCFLAISTSGNSQNLIKAVKQCRLMSVTTIGLTGNIKSKLANLCDITVATPADTTQEIQDFQIKVLHYWHLITSRIYAASSK